MQPDAFAAGWQGYALTGRPDFLNYLRRGDVTWEELWAFYREHPADTAAMVRLMGLFHIFHSQDFDEQGCSLDWETGIYPELRAWAEFVAESADFVPEEMIRESLATLLGQSLVSPLYFEAVFNVYLQCVLEDFAMTVGEIHELPDAPELFFPSSHRLALRLPETPAPPDGIPHPAWREFVDAHVHALHSRWETALVRSLGEDEGWQDEGVSG